MWRNVLGLMLVVACATTIGDLTELATAGILVDDEKLDVVVADTPDLKSRGLMEVEELPDPIDGVLFVYGAPTSVSFHMLNTPIPLDIWWFDEQGVLLGTAEMEPCFVEPCGSYASPGPIKWALETPQGEFGFEAGDLLSTG